MFHFFFSNCYLFDFFFVGTQSPDAVNKLLRLSDSSHQIKTRTPNRPFLPISSSLSNTSVPNSASPSLSNSSTTTGLSSLNESTRHHHHRNHHINKIRDTNKLTSESSSLNFKQSSPFTHLNRSQTRKFQINK